MLCAAWRHPTTQGKALVAAPYALGWPAKTPQRQPDIAGGRALLIEALQLADDLGQRQRLAVWNACKHELQLVIEVGDIEVTPVIDAELGTGKGTVKLTALWFVDVQNLDINSSEAILYAEHPRRAS